MLDINKICVIIELGIESNKFLKYNLIKINYKKTQESRAPIYKKILKILHEELITNLVFQ